MYGVFNNFRMTFNVLYWLERIAVNFCELQDTTICSTFNSWVIYTVCCALVVSPSFAKKELIVTLQPAIEV